jgi:hypothetical protein
MQSRKMSSYANPWERAKAHMGLTATRVDRALLILAAAVLLYVARMGLSHDVKAFCDQIFNPIPANIGPKFINPMRLGSTPMPA